MSPTNIWETLPLTDTQRTALKKQGFVSTERRGQRSIFKLRFRSAGRQQVISLGSDPERAQHVRAALEKLQTPRRSRRILNDRAQEQRQIWSRLREDLDQASVPSPYHRHGRRLRRRRVLDSGRLSTPPTSEFPPTLSGDTPVDASLPATTRHKTSTRHQMNSSHHRDTIHQDRQPAIDSSAAEKQETNREDQPSQALLQILDASDASLTALQKVVGLVTGELMWFLTSYREDIAALRSQLETPAERLLLFSQHSQAIYNLAKQIDIYVRTHLALSRVPRNAAIPPTRMHSPIPPGSVRMKESASTPVRPR